MQIRSETFKLMSAANQINVRNKLMLEIFKLTY